MPVLYNYDHGSAAVKNEGKFRPEPAVVRCLAPSNPFSSAMVNATSSHRGGCYSPLFILLLPISQHSRLIIAPVCCPVAVYYSLADYGIYVFSGNHGSIWAQKSIGFASRVFLNLPSTFPVSLPPAHLPCLYIYPLKSQTLSFSAN